jgi:hypothetical protein
MREDIVNMWQKVSPHRGGPLVGKHFVPFGKSGDMGDNITTHIIHRQNAILKSTKERVLTNLNDIETVTEMDTPDMANFGHSSMLTLREEFMSYKDDSSEPILSSIEAMQKGGSYRLLFNEENTKVVDTILIDVDGKPNAIGNLNDALVHYR